MRARAPRHAFGLESTLTRRGMTLLELLLVMAVLGVLMGAGVGMLSSINLGERAAKGLVQNVLRAARNSSVARGALARVRIDPINGVMRAEAMEVIGTWHFEDQGESMRGAFGLDGALLGAVHVDDGFVGRALAFPRGARSRAVVPVHQYSLYDLSDGFRIEFCLRPEANGGGAVLRLGDAIGVDVSDAGAVAAWFVPKTIDATGKDMKGGRVTYRAPAGTATLGAWTRIAFEYDRKAVTLHVNGVALDPEEPALETLPVWSINDPLVLSGGEAGFVGAIDALVISAVAASEEIELPEGVRFDPGVPAEIRFDADGSLDRAVHREPVVVRLIYEDGRDYPIRVGMYGTVE